MMFVIVPRVIPASPSNPPGYLRTNGHSAHSNVSLSLSLRTKGFSHPSTVRHIRFMLEADDAPSF